MLDPSVLDSLPAVDELPEREPSEPGNRAGSEAILATREDGAG
ncbi:hypothetical protein [Prauserella endophytica]|nr:hypothetical protein [Prauserella endophytica]